MRCRGFEVVKGYEDKGINLPVRKTAHSAGYDVEAAEDIVIPMFTPGCKPTLIPTGLKAYCMEDECYLLLNHNLSVIYYIYTRSGYLFELTSLQIVNSFCLFVLAVYLINVCCSTANYSAE